MCEFSSFEAQLLLTALEVPPGAKLCPAKTCPHNVSLSQENSVAPAQLRTSARKTETSLAGKPRGSWRRTCASAVYRLSHELDSWLKLRGSWEILRGVCRVTFWLNSRFHLSICVHTSRLATSLYPLTTRVTSMRNRRMMEACNGKRCSVSTQNAVAKKECLLPGSLKGWRLS